MITDAAVIKLIEDGREGPRLDFKEDLPLENNGDKAGFVKDVLALANSGATAHLIIGVEDATWKPIGMKTSHTQEKLNQILKDKSDPPLRVEYAEKYILHHKIGVIEITGDNPPYIVAVPDRFGGPISIGSKKSSFIERGTVFIRNFNVNEGARRTDLDKMYSLKFATPLAELRLEHEIKKKSHDDLIEVEINFIVSNYSEVPATDPYIWLQFQNIQALINCTGKWIDLSKLNNNIPTISNRFDRPIYWSRVLTNGAVVTVSKETKQIEADLIMQAGNMRIKMQKYVITLKK